MAWTTIRTAVTLDLPAFTEPVEIHRDPAQHALLALDPATGESEVLTTRLPDFPLLPDEAVVKDWSEHSGLARALAQAGIVEPAYAIAVGPFAATAHRVRVLTSGDPAYDGAARPRIHPARRRPHLYGQPASSL